MVVAAIFGSVNGSSSSSAAETEEWWTLASSRTTREKTGLAFYSSPMIRESISCHYVVQTLICDFSRLPNILSHTLYEMEQYCGRSSNWTLSL